MDGIDLVRWVLLASAVGLVGVSLYVEFRPHANLSDKIRDIYTGKIKSLDQLNNRLILDRKNVSLIEKDLAGLKRVIIVSNRVETPSESAFAPAVIDNFQEGVEYFFFISDRQHEMTEGVGSVINAFQGLHQFALETAPPEGPRSAIRSKDFRQIFSISYLPVNWDNLPYIFYVFGSGEDDHKLLGFKGLEAGVGIASEYKCPSGDFASRMNRLANFGLQGWNRL